MQESKSNVTNERPPYEWLRYIKRFDLSKITDIQTLRFAIEELPECIAYHENWIRETETLMTDLGWQCEVRDELERLKRALSLAEQSLTVALAAEKIQFAGSMSENEFTCDKCGDVVPSCNGCDDDQPNTCDDCYGVKND